MRRCSRCGLEKPLEDFAWHRREKGQRQHHCRPCQAQYRREHYVRNRGRYVERSGRRKQELWAARTQLLLDHFADHPCTDCGETDPLVLEFDHLRDKRFNIGTKLATFPWEVILEEIAKCDVVCANCHRRRTARRRGSNRARLTASEDIPALPKDSTHSG
jgi:5-methylcytosine-specific restriction endonuclease McrA